MYICGQAMSPREAMHGCMDTQLVQMLSASHAQILVFKTIFFLRARTMVSLCVFGGGLMGSKTKDESGSTRKCMLNPQNKPKKVKGS